MSVNKCAHKECPGHLGRFDNCKDEMLWDFALDDSSNGFGDSDWKGYYTRVDIPEETTELLNTPGCPRMVTIPRGFYFVHVTDQGFVITRRFDTPEERDAILEPIEAEYLAWELSE
jgi:hypothetical protein